MHDFNGGIQPSRLFWVVDLPEGAFHVSNDRRRASLHASNVAVIDSFQFGLRMVPSDRELHGRVASFYRALFPSAGNGNHCSGD